jgi:glycosyltransferase involved in cell wall biosynthesis
LRLLFYNQAPEISGAERSLLSIMVGAVKSGHDVLLSAPAGALTDEAQKKSIPFVPAEQVVLGYTRNPLVMTRYALHAFGRALALRRTIRAAQPDVVHANSIRSGLIAALAITAFPRRPGLVIHARDGPHGSTLNRLVRWVLRRADSVIAISNFVAQPLCGQIQNLRVLHNAIEPSDYRRNDELGALARSRIGLQRDALVLATVGQLTPWKGHMDALDAFGTLRLTHPQAHFVIAGSSKFKGAHRRFDTGLYEIQLRHRSTAPDVEGHVHLVGELECPTELYSAADLLVVPSWEEPFGRVVIEAMAAGCPVLGTDSGGIPEIITHGVDGWLVPPRDIPALEDAMRTLLDNEALRSSLARGGLATVESRFSLDSYMRKLEDIWLSSCRKRKEQ